jgi:hypothetical protein
MVREGTNDTDPDLARLLRQVDQWISELGIDAKAAVKFLQGRHESVAARPGHLRTPLASRSGAAIIG